MAHKLMVVIPCYNVEKYIGETIASVKAQSTKGWKCVIVDDGSTDGSPSIIDEATSGDGRFKVFHTENRGVSAARNIGIQAASGGYILPLDADDRLLPYSVKTFLAEWKAHPDASLIVPQIRKFGDCVKTYVQDRTWRGYEHLKSVCTPTNSSSFRWSDWNRVGGYRHGTMYEDWEFWLRLLYHNDNVINVPEVLIEYRVHSDSRWHEAVKRHDAELQIIRQMNPQIFGL